VAGKPSHQMVALLNLLSLTWTVSTQSETKILAPVNDCHLSMLLAESASASYRLLGELASSWSLSLSSWGSPALQSAGRASGNL
jgi:hypothetical protein